MVKTKKNALEQSNKQSRKEKRKTWSYIREETAKKMNLCLAVTTLIVASIILLMCLLPAVKVENISLGNFYYFTEIAIRNCLHSFEGLSVELIGSQSYNDIIFTFAIACGMIVLCGILLLYKGCVYLISYFKNIEICIDKVNLKNIIFSIIISCVLMVTIFFCIAIWDKVLFFRCTFIWVIPLIIIGWIYLTIIINIKYSKDCEKVTKEKVYSLVHNEKKDKKLKQQYNRVKFNKFAVMGISIIFLCIQVLNSNIYFKPVLDGFFKLSKPVLINYYEVGDFTGSVFGFLWGDEEVFTVQFGENEKEFKEEYNVYWDVNYYFYQSQIKILEQERDELMPEDISENATLEEIEEILEKYVKKIEAIQEKIDTLENVLNKIRLPKETIKIKKNEKSQLVVTEIIYDTRRVDKTQFKYGDRIPNYFSLYKESVSLKENIFSKDTDFTKIDIVATITYKDGSIKTSAITPTNINNLNELPIGKHVIEWIDDWGKYCAEIIIK